MEQLILHLIGDYVTQTQRMADRKTKSYLWAAIHAVIYSLPFFLLGSWQAVAIIAFTHFGIDRFRLARFVVFSKNKATEPRLKWEDCSGTGYHKDVPAWMAVWLMIIADNTVHLSLNYAALRWL